MLLVNSSLQAPSDKLKLLSAARRTQQVQPTQSNSYQSQPSYKQVPLQQYIQTTQPSYTTPRPVYANQPSYATPAVPQYQSQPSYNQVPPQQYIQTTQPSYTTPRQVYATPAAPVYQQPQRPAYTQAYSTPAYQTTQLYTQRAQQYQVTQSYTQPPIPQQYQQTVQAYQAPKQQYNQPQPATSYQQQRPQQTYQQSSTYQQQQYQQPASPMTYQQRHPKFYQAKPNPLEDQIQYSKVNHPEGYLQNIRSYEQNPCLSNPCRFNKICTPSPHVPEGYFCAGNEGKSEEKKAVAQQMQNVVMPAKYEIMRRLESPRRLSSNDNIIFLKGTIFVIILFQSDNIFINLKLAKGNTTDVCLNEPCTDGFKCISSEDNEDGYVCVPNSSITTTTTTTSKIEIHFLNN